MLGKVKLIKLPMYRNISDRILILKGSAKRIKTPVPARWGYRLTTHKLQGKQI